MPLLLICDTLEYIIDIYSKHPDEFQREFRRIINKLISNKNQDQDYFGLYKLLNSPQIADILDMDFHNLFGLHYKLDDLNTKEVEIVLYKEWMNHVERLVIEFPWDIIRLVKEDLAKPIEEQKYGLAYHINDVAFLYRDNYNDYILSKTTTRHDLSQNPAQFWLVNRGKIENSIQNFEYIMNKNIKDIIRGWYPNDMIKDKMNDDNRNISLSVTGKTGLGLFLNYNINYDNVFRSFMKKIKLIESNDYINKTWFWHNPPQSKVIEYSPLANYYD